jgi:hypothetical protein
MYVYHILLYHGVKSTNDQTSIHDLDNSVCIISEFGSNRYDRALTHVSDSIVVVVVVVYCIKHPAMGR